MYSLIFVNIIIKMFILVDIYKVYKYYVSNIWILCIHNINRGDLKKWNSQ